MLITVGNCLLRIVTRPVGVFLIPTEMLLDSIFKHKLGVYDIWAERPMAILLYEETSLYSITSFTKSNGHWGPSQT